MWLSAKSDGVCLMIEASLMQKKKSRAMMTLLFSSKDRVGGVVILVRLQWFKNMLNHCNRTWSF
jgi:hypothetical protein